MLVPETIPDDLARYTLAVEEQTFEYGEFIRASQAFDFRRAEDHRNRFLSFADVAFDAYTEACRKLQIMKRCRDG